MTYTNEQMDALISEKVMEYINPAGKWRDKDTMELVTFHPSTDLNNAEKALKKLVELDEYVFVGVGRSQYVRDGYDCSIEKGKYWLGHTCVAYTGSHESLATAICLALLQAVGVDA